METFFQLAFAAAFGVVGLSLVFLILGRVTPKVLLWTTAALLLGALGCLAALAVNLISDWGETDAIVLGAAGFGAAAVAEAGLFALARGLERIREQEGIVRRGEEHITALLEASAAERSTELERTLARERANASHLLGQQERKLTLERRDLIARQADRARAELAHSIEQVQERLEQRLAAWAADLDRGQRALEARLNELARRQADAINAYDARLKADSEHLKTLTEEQQAAVTRLRSELQQVGQAILEEGRSEMEVHSAERTKALQELTSRFRQAERDLREHLEREQADATERLTAGFSDIERRQRENLERGLERSATRLTEDAERRFDGQIKQSREKSAQRLSHELDKQMEQFARRAEKEISDRIGEAAQQAAGRLERRITDITRQAEAQHEVAGERLRAMTERLDGALSQAEARIASFEAQIETQVTARLEAMERSYRSA